MAKWIIVDGGRYPVVDALGYNPDIGARAWVVMTQDGEKKAVGLSTKARFWKPEDRVGPLVEYYQRAALKGVEKT